MASRGAIICFGFSLICFSSCFSQGDGSKKSVPSQTIPASSSSGFLPYQNFAKLSATNDGTIAEANINYKAGRFWNLTFYASSPVTSKTQQTKPLTISGISSNSNLKLGFQKIMWGKVDWEQGKYNAAILKVGGNPEDFSYETLTNEQEQIFDKEAEISWGTAFYYGGKVGFEQQTFSYLIDISNSQEYKEDESKLATSLSLSVGILNRKYGSFALTYTYKNGYKTDVPSTYSIPLSSGVYVQKELSPAAPVKNETNTLRIEYLSYGFNDSFFRINPNLTFDLNHGIGSFQFPVYFLTSDDERSNFNGGVYVGYITDKNFAFNFESSNIGLGVFIGANINDLFK